jgi:regulator of protease activity HflC (stomatin/prohibitin superfamily)
MEFILFLLVIFLLLFCATGFRIANQFERAVVFRFGRLIRVAEPGLFWIIPLIESTRMVDVRTKTTSVDKLESITKDNVPIKVNAVIWLTIFDPAKSIIEAVGVEDATIQVALTALRNIIGRHTLDDVLKNQESLVSDMFQSIDGVTMPWGLKVNRVEMRSVEIPESMQRAMAQEAEAYREKRARIIKAEAELEASEKLQQAARLIMEIPAALELRRMQMITEVGAEQNTTTIIMMPSEFVTMAKSISDLAMRSK